MTRRIVAIDCGTTATKAWIVADGRVIASERSLGGVRDVAQGRDRDRAWLREHIRAVADGALASADIDWSEIDAVVAFGMITSELGLVELPHLPAPVGLDELARGLRDGERDTFPVGLSLVPGVICDGDAAAASTDFMRGEETEATGLLTLDGVSLPLLYVSPGSHTKFVIIDRDRRIRWSFTTLTGELLWALSTETILAGLVDPSDPDVIAEAVDRGAAAATRHGLSRALYAARLLSRLEGESDAFCSSFVMGAVASGDLAALRAAQHEGVRFPGAVHVAHGPPMSAVYHHLMGREDWVSQVRTVEEPLGALGAWALYRASDGRSAAGGEVSLSESSGTSGGS